jgi:hypothetical protein
MSTVERMPRKTCAALLALAAIAIPVATASAASSETSTNWAGYAVSKTGIKYRHVSATWTQKAVDCSSATRSFSAYWVGLGGFSQTSQALEQIGTDADCSSGGTASYFAWYELVPQASVNITSLTIRSGDKLAASVDVVGKTVKLHLSNITRGKTFNKTLTATQVDTTSAEWIVEAPSLCDTQLNVCQTQALANFGTAKFASAKATSAGGHTGGIADPAWSATSISLQSAGGGPGFGPQRFARQPASNASATPSAVSASGASFTVTYAANATQPQTQTSAAPQMPGGFRGGPPPGGAS